MKFTTPQLLFLLSALTSQTLALPTQESRSLTQPHYFPLASSDGSDPTKTVASKRDILSDIKDKIVDVFTSGDSDSSESNKRRLTDKLSEAARLAEQAARERERANNQQDRGGDSSSTGGNQGGDTAGAGGRAKLAVRQQETPETNTTVSTATATATSTTSVVASEATPTPTESAGAPGGQLVVKPIADEEPLTPEQEAALGGGAVTF